MERVRKKNIIYHVTAKLLTLPPLRYDSDDNTWEPRENLDCTDLIEKFERKRKESTTPKPASAKRKRPSVVATPGSKATITAEEKEEKPTKEKTNPPSVKKKPSPKGFARGLEALNIVGATDSPGEITYLVQWKGDGEADLISHKECREKIPGLVIDFYEQRVQFRDQTAEEKAANVAAVSGSVKKGKKAK